MKEFDPAKLPVFKTFDVKNEKEASDVAKEIVEIGFEDHREAIKILMPKETKLAKRIGYTITTSINYGLRQNNKHRSVRYWTYHHDETHYAIVFINSELVDNLDF